MTSHVTKAEVDDRGGEIGTMRFVGRASCACKWSTESQPKADWEIALAWAKLAAAGHRLLAALDE